MKYSWKAKSDDGCYEANGRLFATKVDAFNDMRESALEKMLWNTEWGDLDDYDSIGYQVHFSHNVIRHKSYSGEYTYTLIEVDDKVKLHDRTWEIIDSFTPKEMYDWLIATFDGVGEMWMNNHDGYMVLIEPSGRVLKSDI